MVLGSTRCSLAERDSAEREVAVRVEAMRGLASRGIALGKSAGVCDINVFPNKQ